MSKYDKLKWDKKYRDFDISLKPISLVIEYAKKAGGKRALDIACGMGRHSRYLAGEGFLVDALDISYVALKTLENEKNIFLKEVDFDTYELECDSYDLIVCTYFLQRSLFPQIVDALKNGGVLLMQTYTSDSSSESSPINKKFLLKSHELKNFFEKSCDILFYEERFSTNPKKERSMIASLAARKKGSS